MHQICTDELALHLGEGNVRCKRVFHFQSALFERCQQIAMSALEVFENFGKLLLRDLALEAEHTINDVIGSRLVCRFEISWFRGGFEGPHHDACGIRS